MQEVTAPLPDPRHQIMRPTRVGLCLRAHAVQLDLLANYGELLQTMILCRLRDRACDAKLINKFQRLLKTTDAYHVLTIIWKESDFISDEDLERVGWQTRSFDASTIR